MGGNRGDDSPVQTPHDLREVYDEIASHFSETRAYPWPEIESFLDAIDGRSASLGVDVGCGNGRHTELLADVTDTVIGLDVSRGLLQEARAKMAEDGWIGQLLQGNAAELPLDSGTVDVAVYVATLHHLPNRETRVRSLRELDRVLGDDGRALVSAWSTAHDRFDTDGDEETGFETTIDWTLPGGETVPRFYYIYAPAEFERDIRESGLTIEESYVSSGNCYAAVR
jgi:ubiquinone/menaquinone biosynthesis C-methylase UbiE